jgi:O-antigen ligase/polysaccharide polymerase Wzy-like membrane protein
MMVAVEQPRRLRKTLTLAGLLVASAVIGTATVGYPRQAALAAVLIACTVVLCAEPTVALYLLVGSFYFDSYLSHGAGVVTVGKLLGALVVIAWVLDGARRGRTLSRTPELPWLGGFLVVVLVSAAAASSATDAASVGSRYVMFAAVFLIISQSTRDLTVARGVASSAVVAATAASCVGLAEFAIHRDRASGPLAGADDLGFLLASTVPVAIWWGRRMRPRLGIASYLPSLLICACVFATLSRGAVLALVVAAVWALATGRMRIPWSNARSLVLVAIVFGLLATTSVAGSALQRKQEVAAANVTNRLDLWRVAVREFRANPLIGVGPGNYTVRFSAYSDPFAPPDSVQTTHNAYLNVLAELGIAGAVLFVGYLICAWRTVTSAVPVRDPELLAAAAAGFLVALVGALFLTEQFYAPLWFWPALASGVLAGAARSRGSSA